MSGGPPILITGSHRSGTTWVGRILSLSGEVEVAHEPFHPELYRSWLADPPPRWFEYVHPTGGDVDADDVARALGLRPRLRPMLRRASNLREHAGAVREWTRARRGRLLGRRVLIKDPIAFFSAEWLARRFGVVPVVLIRHPAAFAGSLKRLNWTFDFRNLTEQPHLLAGPLRSFRHEISRAVVEERDVIDQAILLWRLINRTALSYREHHPDWPFLRYEDLAEDPLTGFADLYAALGLTWSTAVAEGVSAHTASTNGTSVPTGEPGGVRRDSRAAAWTWIDRLTPTEIERVRHGTLDVAEDLYSSEHWVPPGRRVVSS